MDMVAVAAPETMNASHLSPVLTMAPRVSLTGVSPGAAGGMTSLGAGRRSFLRVRRRKRIIMDRYTAL